MLRGEDYGMFSWWQMMMLLLLLVVSQWLWITQ